MTTFAHALLGILPGWRCLCSHHLPVGAFLGPRARVLRLQALRCEACPLQPRCRRLIAGGGSRPARGCPNAELFA